MAKDLYDYVHAVKREVSSATCTAMERIYVVSS